MPKTTHFDIGAWAREKAMKQQEVLERNETIAELNEEIKSQESKITELKRKVCVLFLVCLSL